MRPIELEPPRRVLIVKPSALGDVVHALPVAALLKRRWPEARLSWLVSRPFAPLLETNPHVDEPIPFDRGRGTGLMRQSGNARRLARELRGRGFDLVMDLQGLLRSGWLAWQTRAPIRVGFAYAREAAALFYTHRVTAPPRERHAVERYLDVAELLGLGRAPVEFPLVTTPEDEQQVQSVLAPLDNEPFAVLLPGTNWATKRWPAERFADLAVLLERRRGLRIVIAGGADAADAAAVVRSIMPAALDLVGRTDIRQLVALVGRAALAVTNDSGPMHIAAALGTPLVSLFGPTSPSRTGPYGRAGSVVRLEIPCSPCFSRRCSHQSCLKLLPAAEVLERCPGAAATGASSPCGSPGRPTSS